MTDEPPPVAHASAGGAGSPTESSQPSEDECRAEHDSHCRGAERADAEHPQRQTNVDAGCGRRTTGHSPVIVSPRQPGRRSPPTSVGPGSGRCPAVEGYDRVIDPLARDAPAEDGSARSRQCLVGDPPRRRKRRRATLLPKLGVLRTERARRDADAARGRRRAGRAAPRSARRTPRKRDVDAGSAEPCERALLVCWTSGVSRGTAAATARAGPVREYRPDGRRVHAAAADCSRALRVPRPGAASRLGRGGGLRLPA